MMHVCVDEPDRRQAVCWTYDDLDLQNQNSMKSKL